MKIIKKRIPIFTAIPDNIIMIRERNTYLSDFGLSKPTDKQESSDQVYGVLPYLASEVLYREPYTLASDIYSFGVIITELSSGLPPFHNRKHDMTLALDICNGLRPEFGKGTPEFFKKLAYKCMDAIPIQRPMINDLRAIWVF
ncbi:4204_t:CDS:2 [Funneliformis geosporum]|uniref:11552_t:CDS:1 n=1 Tax=Funneliformis geosporum TaxID=1117311 RepID=A0A9W4SM44_9GLOM|nr:4204_t:CDS:2 [Funneliformis geosporum]CAI2175132.1 11552_t:CDS:2 [Funneliformis geosporum]